MKKIFLLTLLLLVTCSAWAKWVSVGTNDEIAIHIDLASIRKDGNLRKVWEIQDLKQPETNGQISRRMRLEFDCKNERQRILSLTTHSEPMATGSILSNAQFNDGEWNDIPPGTFVEDIRKIVCTK